VSPFGSGTLCGVEVLIPGGNSLVIVTNSPDDERWLFMARFRKSLLLVAAALITSVLVGSAAWVWATRPTVEMLVEQARDARRARDSIRARRFAESALKRRPASTAVHRLLGQIERDAGNFDEAIAHFDSASNGEGVEGVASLIDAGRLCLQQGLARRAEEFFKQALARSDKNVDAASELAYLLAVEGRGWEAQQHLLTVVRGGHPTLHHMVLLAASEPVVKDTQLVARCLKRDPNDLVIRTGEARSDLFEGRSERALTALREIVKSAPHVAESQARLGWAILELHPGEFPRWQRTLSGPGLRDHPEIWAVQGDWSLRNRDFQEAARCFAHAVQLDSEHRMANYQLGKVLTTLGRSDEAQPFLDRASKLQQLALLADRIYAHPQETLTLRQATELTAALGRPHEAWGWCWIAAQVNPRLEWATKNADKFFPWLATTAPRVIPDALPKIPEDLLQGGDSRPAPSSDQIRVEIANPNPTEFGAPLFEDVAAKAGLDFVYDAGSRRKSEGVDLIEFPGGGVAAFDFDRDDRCDLYFTQGRPLPLSTQGDIPTDRLFRQGIDGRASDVTSAAGLGDADYSHGCTVGDFNQDGFADLYVCNVGRNRLYLNHGDGTFADVTDEAGIAGLQWTTSTLFVDLNGDGLPELFDVNYLDIDPNDIPFCHRGAEDTHCAPTARPPAPDTLWLNTGDGRFQDISRDAGLLAERDTGRGLGIVAADLNGDGRVDLFIANDAEPNFFYFSDPPGRGHQRDSNGELKQLAANANDDSTRSTRPHLEERAVVSGVAYDRDGLAQACMGVAIGDADHNGLLDLFVTNYADQSNTLYLQVEPGVFQDGTREAGLREPSYSLLGFGTQFIDADLDGWQDLILTNGHVYDMSYAGKQYAMRPQFFRNSGRGRFVESFRETAGEFFGERRVGRGLARLDWNRDGREDIVISHIGSPAALLLNRTEPTGHWIGLSLTGTTSERDAIGTRIQIKRPDGSTLWHHVTGGSGYMAHNESRVVIGLGSASEVDELELIWPSGARQSFSHVAADHRYVAIEGRNTLLPMKTP
jgi:tetratricopeptide (TPR) repeat protein